MKMELGFFNSIWFGIIAMVIVGGSWCLIGFVMGDAPKRGIEPSLVQLFGAFFSVSCSTVILLLTGRPECPASVLLLTCGAYMVSGLINFSMLQIMSYAMQRGPNGIIWSIIQSALIFPFLGGMLFFGMEATTPRLLGLGLLVFALLLFALGKDNSNHSGSWLLPAFICFLLCGVQQNIATAPSYFESARAVNSITRALSTAGGTLTGAVLYNLVLMTPERWKKIRANLGNRTLWKYICALQFFNLIFAYTLFYPGMNAMADAGAGGVCYPLMVGSCIVTFSLCSILLLKEKIRLLQGAAILLCLSGLIGLCWP